MEDEGRIRADDSIAAAIRLATRAGGYSEALKRHPNRATALEPMRRRFSTAASELLTEYAARAVGSSYGPSGREEG